MNELRAAAEWALSRGGILPTLQMSEVSRKGARIPAGFRSALNIRLLSFGASHPPLTLKHVNVLACARDLQKAHQSSAARSTK
jgi:hypothetical protein